MIGSLKFIQCTSIMMSILSSQLYHINCYRFFTRDDNFTLSKNIYIFFFFSFSFVLRIEKATQLMQDISKLSNIFTTMMACLTLLKTKQLKLCKRENSKFYELGLHNRSTSLLLCSLEYIVYPKIYFDIGGSS